ncbi:pyridoxal phosphate-dependent decarboxylase family protein [Larkinella soli]|uniref:pyridoxal phosphate-dependent decarboxylase family protein n=1 Tax=Larkinella soli TaxID=1770527 RepID=UPI000FFB8DE8|nr:pyridoxal-dependent decarboxylase [Larkinella soli]
MPTVEKPSASKKPYLPGDESLGHLLHKVGQYAEAYLSRLSDLPTSRQVPDLPDLRLPEAGLGGEAALAVFDERFREVLVAASGPRYWGFVTGGTTPAAIAGDWLTAVFDQNPQSLTGPSGGDVSATIEAQTIALYRQLFGLPDAFLGGFVTGATMANFTGLAVGRQWAGRQVGHDTARAGVLPGSVRVLAASPHSSSIKSLALLGLGSASLEAVRTLPGREAMDPDHLADLLEQEPGRPVIVIASGGTVNTVDFDDMQALAALKGRRPFWLHVDAAFGGFAAVSPALASRLTGWEQADSIAIDNHKWMNVPYDNAVWLVRREYASLQVETFQNTNAPYLGDPLANFNYLNMGPENSRRLRALPVWLSLMAYGRSGFQTLVEQSVHLAERFGQMVEESGFLQLEAPVRLNVVCFSLRHHRTDPAWLRAFHQALNADGRVFVTPTSYNGAACLRAAFVNWRTTEADLDTAMEAMQESWRQIQGPSR